MSTSGGHAKRRKLVKQVTVEIEVHICSRYSSRERGKRTGAGIVSSLSPSLSLSPSVNGSRNRVRTAAEKFARVGTLTEWKNGGTKVQVDIIAGSAIRPFRPPREREGGWEG